MYFESLELEGFRNYTRAAAEFSGDVNILKGDNAQGKTNMLEALYVLCAGRSFRARSDRELVGFGADFASVTGTGRADGRDKNVRIVIRPGKRRSVTVNGVKVRTASELSGGYAAVLFRPEDLELVRGGAAERRRFMDMCISQLRPRYAAALREFSKAYEGKTRILRDFREKPSLMELLDEYDNRLCQMSAELIHYRALFIKSLAPEAAKIHSDFSHGETLGIEYRTIKTIDDPTRPSAELLPLVMEHLRGHRDAEIASGLCLTGAHKDELEITIDGVQARGFASQGQARTAALSMKLAEREIHYRNRGEYPVLLLDDVLSELDPARQDFVLNRIGGGQVFITCCEDDRITERTGGKVTLISGGALM